MAAATQAAVLKTGASPPPPAGIAVADGARAPPSVLDLAPGETLLTPKIILARLGMASADPAKWLRRTFKKHGVPFVHACGKLSLLIDYIIPILALSPIGKESVTNRQ